MALQSYRREASLPAAAAATRAAASSESMISYDEANKLEPKNVYAISVGSFTVLQSFAIYAEDTSIDDGTGVAMAEALQRNTSLESFTFNANETSFGDKRGVAMADALERKHEPSQEERREERG